MQSKSGTKKKEGKSASTYPLLKDDDEIKAELQAMAGLEYTMHKETQIIRKNRGPPAKELGKTTGEKIASKDKVEMETSIPYLSSNVSVSELQTVIRQAATTSEDRYKILEARDRLMKLKRKKIHTLDTAKATRGTCPDMCPEKERLMREFQRQVAAYELEEGAEYKINHEMAIKQYSRSSADQEEPMPQDLRPVSSLKMTMSYLLHEIIDLCDEEGTNLAEWYHFLWDRTRGIRKDITQQELCCLDTVHLVEQCARFHIVCSERLYGEELSVFDAKINTENLTKCLQTLKYMYHDLRLNGITCDNEPEFRGYIILLNLNNANFMWDLQALPSSIQKSPEVNFAIQVYSSIQSNNYSKFFKLVAQTTYLNACILLRYFYQVRVQALNIMVKAYCRTTSTAYPLYEFIDILGFEDENEAGYFCEQAGLNISSDELHIILNRQNMTPPPAITTQGRSRNLVESKRIALDYSLGQVIAGSEMPERYYVDHTPHDSFNAQGYLKSEAIDAQDQNGCVEQMEDNLDPYEFIDEDLPIEEEMEDRNSGEMVPSEPEIISQPESPESDENHEFSDSFWSSVRPKDLQKSQADLECKNKSTKSVENEFNQSITTSDDNLSPRVKSEVFAVAPEPEVFARPVPIIPVATSPPTTPILRVETPENMCKIDSSATESSPSLPIAAEGPGKALETREFEEQAAQREAERQKILERIEKLSFCIVESVENQVIHDMCLTILHEQVEQLRILERLGNKILDDIIHQVVAQDCEVIFNEEYKMQQQLQTIFKQMKNRIMLKYTKIWRQRVAKRKQQRKALDNTPVWLARNSLEDCAKSFYDENQSLVIRKMRLARQVRPRPVENRNYLDPVEMQISRGIREHAKLLDIQLGARIFWKMIVSWPYLQGRVLLERYKKIMNEYFCPQDSSMNRIIKVYKPNEYETLHLCLAHCEGQSNESDTCGLDALFFIISADEEAKITTRRLTKTVLSRAKLMPIPIFVAVFGNSLDPQPFAALQDLLKAGYLSEYIVHQETTIDESTILNITQKALLWLSRKKSPPIPLEMDLLASVVDKCLADEMWLRISGHATFNSGLLRALESPEFLINLHNQAVGHLINILMDPENLFYTDFPVEFKEFLPIGNCAPPCAYEYVDYDWKNEDYREKIERTLVNFNLPAWTFAWPIDDQMTLYNCVLQYCREALNMSVNIPMIVCSIVSNICLNDDEIPNFVFVLLEIVKEKLRIINGDLRVVYNKNHVNHFKTLPWWFKSGDLVDYTKLNEDVEPRELPEAKRPRFEESKESIREAVDMFSSILDDDTVESTLMDISVAETHDSSIKLEKMLQRNQQMMRNLDEKLGTALSE